MSVALYWGSTEAERARHYPCDDLFPHSEGALFRAIDIQAPAPIVFRWLCQLRVAPYSYDWIDNLGRRSPRALTPGLDQLAVGQPVMTIFRLRSFERDRHLTIAIDRKRPDSFFGNVAVTYWLDSVAPPVSRLVVKLALQGYGKWKFHALAWGDFIMMRRQLLNLKYLAERS